jgi:hypothetical protein
MRFRIQNALDALAKQSDAEGLRAALPLVIELYVKMVEKLLAPTASEDDLCAVVQHAADVYARIAAERLLTDPGAYLQELTLASIVQHVPSCADEAARQLLVRKEAPTNAALAMIVTWSNAHAHEAANRLLDADASSDDLALIMVRVPELGDRASAKLGSPLGLPLGELPVA